VQACLKGSLEDFSIQDVLQLVSLGGKTGCLSLESPAGDGAILFRKGRVLGSRDTGTEPQAAGRAQPPGSRRDELIRERMVVFLDRLARARQGEFRFESSDSRVEIEADRAPEMLRTALDVIALLLELANRQEQEDRDSPAAVPVLLVDDEEQVRHFLARHLVAAGYRVVEARDVESAVESGARLGEGGGRFVLVADADMPASLGNSFRGGFEIVKRLARLQLRPAVVMMAHDASSALKAMPKRQSWSVVMKPGLSKLDPAEFEADMRALAVRMVEEILPRVCGPGHGLRSEVDSLHRA
jgi:CheY-like chemotaxis protein